MMALHSTRRSLTQAQIRGQAYGHGFVLASGVRSHRDLTDGRRAMNALMITPAEASKAEAPRQSTITNE
jgi:hypothetical protein